MIGQFSHDCIGWKTWKGRNPPKTDDKLYTSLSGQDGAILPARDYLLYPARKISQVCSVKMAGYWSHSFFVRNTQKKNLANIQTSWPHTWSITHISWPNILVNKGFNPDWARWCNPTGLGNPQSTQFGILQGIHKGPSNRQIDQLWGGFSQLGLTFRTNVFLTLEVKFK